MRWNCQPADYMCFHIFTITPTVRSSLPETTLCLNKWHQMLHGSHMIYILIIIFQDTEKYYLFFFFVTHSEHLSSYIFWFKIVKPNVKLGSMYLIILNLIQKSHTILRSMIHTIEQFNVSSRECSKLGLPLVKGITKRKALSNVMHIPEIRVMPLENKRRGTQKLWDTSWKEKQNNPLECGTAHWQVVDVKFHFRMHSPKYTIKFLIVHYVSWVLGGFRGHHLTPCYSLFCILID